jgi:hypothetical protein
MRSCLPARDFPAIDPNGDLARHDQEDVVILISLPRKDSASTVSLKQADLCHGGRNRAIF